MSGCHSFSHGPLLHRTFEQLSLRGAPEQGTRALIVDRSLCLRNNATVAEISPLGGDNYITEEKVALRHTFHSAPSRVVSQSRLLGAQSEQSSAQKRHLDCQGLRGLL